MKKINKSVFVLMAVLLLSISLVAAIYVFMSGDQTIRAGESATFTCTVDPMLGPANYEIRLIGNGVNKVIKSGTGTGADFSVDATITPSDYGIIAEGSSKDFTVQCTATETLCEPCCCDSDTQSAKLKIYNCPPSDWMCSVDEVRQFWKYTWNGQTCVFSITQEAEHCNDYDRCYAYSTGCEDRDYYCVESNGVGAPCSYDFTNRHVDSYGNYVNYCKSDDVYKHRQFHDYYCGNTCTDHVSWADDQLVQDCGEDGCESERVCGIGNQIIEETTCFDRGCASNACFANSSTTTVVIEDCDDKDGWYDTSNTKWVDTSVCTEKQQKEQKYREYSCASAACTYAVTSTRWVDTTSTRNKADGTICAYESGICEKDDICIAGTCTEKYQPYGTSCTDGQYCNGNEICNDVGQCIGGSAIDCTGFNIFKIATCDYVPDSIHFTWDFRNAFTSTCDEVNDKCTLGISTIYHECSVLNCDAECDDTNLCAPNTCSETYNDYCVAKKLADYNNNNVKDSKTVTDSCARNCLFASCECTDCSVSCEATPTEKCVPGVCGAVCNSNDDCDDGIAHTIDTCLNDCTCKHDSTEYCGDGIVQTGETCELPSTSNNNYCSQSLSECSGNKLGTRDAFGNCNSQCGCNNDPFQYICVKDSCGATCDDNSDCANYCDGNIMHTGSSCDLTTTCSCTGGSTFDCDTLDGWYDTGATRWDGTVICQEKEQKEQKYREYSCTADSIVNCTYTITGTQWTDTGNTRNVPDGTVCDDGLWCSDNDVCTAGQCGGLNRNCNGFNITRIETCFNTPDGFHFTWDFRNEFLSVCDEENDRCTTGDETITHTCDVDRCGAQCTTDADCYDKDPNTADTCGEDCTCVFTPIVRRSSGGGGSGGGSSVYIASTWTCPEWSECNGGTQTRTCAKGSITMTENQDCEMPVVGDSSTGAVTLTIEQPVVEETVVEETVSLESTNSAPIKKGIVEKALGESNEITGAATGFSGENTPLFAGIFFLVLGGAIIAFFLLKK